MLNQSLSPVVRLRYVNDGNMEGLRRRRTGRKIRVGKARWTPEFVIEDSRGRPVRDPTVLERARKLAIPPAWEDVWICPLPNGHIQATGRDARGRKQYRYHAQWRLQRDQTKYHRMLAFSRALPKIRRRVQTDLNLRGLPREKVLAAVVRLLETTFMRVGNEEYARANHSFGLTTLKNGHVDILGGQARFHFRGKSGVSHRIIVTDPRVVRVIRRCRDLPGQHIFEYIADDASVHAIDSADVNGYLQRIAGQDFTAKDFRTWAGTVLFGQAVGLLALDRKTPPVNQIRAATRRPPPQGASASGKGPPKNNPRAATRTVVRAIAHVSARLGNTPAVCRKCYVHPAVIQACLSGTFFSRRPSAVRPRGLRPEEAAVLPFLAAA